MKYLGFVVWTFMCSFLWLGSSLGVALVQNVGRTGAPRTIGGNEALCSSCHQGGNFGTQVLINVLEPTSGTPVSSWSPAETYDVRVDVLTTVGNPAAFGFQLVAIKDSDLSNAGLFTEAGDDVQFRSLASVNRSYAEHDKPRTDGNTFSFRWTAPAAGSGPVTLYASGNAVDLDFLTTGDQPDNASITLTENPVTLIESAGEFVLELHLYPNPVSNTLYISVPETGSLPATLEIFDILGRQMFEAEVQTVSGMQLPVTDWPVGFYLVRISKSKEIVTRTFVKR